MSPGSLQKSFIGRCKYGYLNGQGHGQFCVGAHGASSDCRAFRMLMTLTFADGSMATFFSSNDEAVWKATTTGNRIRYSHLFHGEIYDANIIAQPADYTSVIIYNTTDRDQTGLPQYPTLHTMPPIIEAKILRALSLNVVNQSIDFVGRFIKATNNENVYWQSNASDTMKHFVAHCAMFVFSCQT